MTEIRITVKGLEKLQALLSEKIKLSGLQNKINFCINCGEFTENKDHVCKQAGEKNDVTPEK